MILFSSIYLQAACPLFLFSLRVQAQDRVIGPRITEVLQTLETNGGPDVMHLIKSKVRRVLLM
jgi:hypothetical protein